MSPIIFYVGVPETRRTDIDIHGQILDFLGFGCIFFRVASGWAFMVGIGQEAGFLSDRAPGYVRQIYVVSCHFFKA